MRLVCLAYYALAVGVLPALAQNVDYTVVVHQINHFENPNCDDGLAGPEEYTAVVFSFDDADPTPSGGDCFPITVAGDAVNVVDALLTSRTNSSATGIVIRLDAWEDDGGSRCQFDAGDDDCRLQVDFPPIPFRNDPRAVLNRYGPFGSPFSHQVTVDILWTFTAPAIPTDLNAEANNLDENITVSWDSAANATEYDVYRSGIDPAEPEALLGSTGGTDFVDGTVVAGATYQYRVQATNPDGISGFSDPVEATFAGPGGVWEPWRQFTPQGSLIYVRNLQGQQALSPSGDVDALEIDLEPDTLLGLVAAVDTNLVADIEIFSPDGSLLASVQNVPGEQIVLLQSLPVLVPGTHTVRVSSAGGETGFYDLALFANLMLEGEAAGLGFNNTLGNAQDLDVGYLAVDGSGGRIAAVAGGYAAQPVESYNFESGLSGFTIDNTFGSGNGLWHLSSGRRDDGLPYHSPSNSLYYGTGEDATGNGNYNTPGFANGGAITSPEIVLPDEGPIALQCNMLLDREGGTTIDIPEIAVLTNGVADVIASSADSTLTRFPEWTRFTADLSAYTGATIRLRFSFDTGDNVFNLFEGWYIDDVRIVAGAPVADGGDEDIYLFTLAPGETASVSLTQNKTFGTVPAGTQVELELLDGAGDTVFSTPPGAVDPYIGPFRSETGTTYYARVTNPDRFEHRLVVTREMVFDPGGPEPIRLGDAGRLLGYADTNAVDTIEFHALAGDTLTVTTRTPGDGPFAFTNGLNPRIELFDPTGASVAADSDSAPDGKNAMLSYLVPSGGVFQVAVEAEDALPGEYLVEVTGSTAPSLPFEVVETVPADGALVTNLSSLAVSFSGEVDLTTLEEADLLLNGSPAATNLSLAGADAAVFALPPLADGTYTVALATGSVRRIGGTPLSAYGGSFVLDASPPTLLSGSVTNLEVIGTPTLVYTATLSEPLDPATVAASNITLVGGTSGAYPPDAVAFDPHTLVLSASFSGLAEDFYTLTLLSGGFADPAGLALDGEPLGPGPDGAPTGDGIPGGDYTIDFSVEYATVPLGSLEPVRPLGSLAYETSIEAELFPSGDNDAFTVELDPDQQLTAVCIPRTGSSFSPALFIRDAGNVLVAADSTAGPGETAVIQLEPVPVAGTYTVIVGGGDEGSYTLRLYLNAAVEEEEHGGPENDTLATAQDLDPAFLSLGFFSGSRASVIGGITPRVSSPVFEAVFLPDADGFTFDNTFGSGNGLWHLSTGRSGDGLPGHSPPNALYYGANETASGGGDYDTGSANGGAAISPLIALPASPPMTLQFNHFLETEGDSDFDNARVAISAGAGFTTLASSFSGGLPTGTGGEWATEQFDLAAFAGSNVTLRFTFDTDDAEANDFEGWYLDDIAVGTALPTADHYRFSLGAGGAASIVLDSVGPTAGNRTLEVYDASGTLLAVGTPLANADQVIAGLVAPLGQDYIIRVDGDPGPYSLTVTRPNAFEQEPNDTAATPIEPSGPALGAIDPAGDVDRFAFAATAGNTLILGTTTPAGGPGQFENLLDPALELFDPTGASVAADDNSETDGRNAVITHEAAVSGVYTVAVTGAAATTGEYVLRVIGAPGSAPPFEAIDTDPVDGAFLAAFPATLRVDFNRPVRLTSVDASDLTVGGLPATAATVLDGDTLEFAVDPAANTGEGPYTVALAGGSLTSLGDEPLVAFAGTFTLDTTPPRVILSSIQLGDTIDVSSGTLTYTVQFDEPLDETRLGPNTISLDGSVSGSIPVDSFVYDPTNSFLTVEFLGMEDDAYSLRLDDFDIRDRAGLQLDGEALAFPIPPNPSGNGTEGGDFEVGFAGDIATAGVAAPFVPSGPPGSLGETLSVSGAIQDSGDVDTFALDLNGGQVLTAVVDPAAGLQVQLQVRRPDGVPIAVATSSSPGLDTVVQTVLLAEPGTYFVDVDGQSTTTGAYTLDVLLNSAVELESHDGPANDSPVSAQGIDASLIPLKSLRPRVDGIQSLQSSEGNDTAGDPLVPGIGPAPVTYTVEGFIGDNPTLPGPDAGKDVDLLAIELDAGTRVTIDVDAAELGSPLDPILRLFDPSLNPIAVSDDDPAPGEPGTLDSFIDFTASAAGTYLVGVSGFSNFGYNPAVAGSGSAGSTGIYDLVVMILGDDVEHGAVRGRLPPGPGLAEDFESGALDGSWSTSSSSTNGRIRITGEFGTAEGAFAMIMDTTENVTLNEAVWTVDLTGAPNPWLRFSHAEWGDEQDPLPADFTGSVNGDGVAISDDGTNWHTVVNAPQQIQEVWESYRVDLASEAAAAGMTLGATFQVKFQQYDNFPLLTDGRGYDQIAIVPPPDHYRIHLLTNDVVSLGLRSGGSARLDLLDGTGAGVLASGSVVVDFAPPTNGTYVVRIDGENTEYSLLVARNAGIDREANHTLTDAQPIGVTGRIIGTVGTPDVFVFDVEGTDEILRIDPDTGAVRARFASPVADEGSDAGLATTPTSLLVGGVVADGIAEIGFNGSVLRVLPNPGDPVSGIAFLDNEIYLLTDDFDGQITVLDYVDGSVSRVITTAVTISEGLVSDGARLLGRGSDDTLHEIDPLTGATTLLGPLTESSDVEGLAVAENKLLVTDVDEIDVYDLSTLGFLRTLPFPGDDLEALGGDGNVVGDDIYRFAAQAGDAILVSTETPLDGPLGAGNPLDPRIELFDPDDTLVASDANSAPDGKNAALAVLAAASGDYRVQVSQETTGAGEYLAHVVVVDGTLDSDNDTLPDAWEVVNGLDPDDDGTLDPDNGANGDPDDDGATNREELDAMTDPRDPASVFRITDIAVFNNPPAAEITFTTVPGKWQTLEYNDVSAHPPGFAWRPFADLSDGVGAWLETGPVENVVTLVDDYTPATSGGPAAGGFRLYRVTQGPPTLTPRTIAVFLDPGFVDAGEEGTNTIASLEALGHTVNAFTGITASAFSAATLGADLLVIPELQDGDLAAVLDPAAVGVISNFVAGGKTMIVHGESGGHDEALVNLVLGMSIGPVPELAGPYSRTADADGTIFQFGPASVPANSGTYPWGASTLPLSGVDRLYQSGDSVAVARIQLGSGRVIFLAWDWFNAAPRESNDGGWLLLQRLATEE